MGDMGDDFRAMKEDRKKRHKEMHARNREVIDASGAVFVDKGEALLFREPFMPRVDFYPSTGRWKVAGETPVLRGGAQVFLHWYAARRRSC